MESPNHKSAQSPYLSKPQYLHLAKGSKVEVTSKCEGYVDSWFEATVLKPPENPRSSLKKKRLTLIEYVELVNEDGMQLHTEIVDHVLLRPLPPKVVVDVDGGFGEGDLVDCFDRDGWWTGVVKSVPRVRAGNDDHGGDDEKEVRYLVMFKDPEDEMEFRGEDMRVHLDWMEGKWWYLPQDDVLQELSFSVDGHVTLPNHRSREIVKSEKNVVGINAESLVDKPGTLSDQKLDPGLSARFQQESIYVEHPNSSSIHSPPSKKLKRPCAEPFVEVSSEPTELINEDSACSSLYVATAVDLRVNGVSTLRDCQYKDPTGKSDPSLKADSHFTKGFKRTNIMKQLSGGTPVSAAENAQKAGVYENPSVQEEILLAAATELTRDEQGEVPVDENVQKNPGMEEHTLALVGEETTCKGHGEVQKMENVHQNLSSEMEVVGTDVTHEEPGTSNLASDALVASPVGEAVGRHEGQLGCNGYNSTSVSLPFVKSSPIWKAVEALDMFRLFPQKPHFQPLINASERYREGLAVAEMVTFATTVENVIKLSVHSPLSSFTDSLDMLRSLETHGFNTKTIERRVLKLLPIKRTQGKVDEKKEEVYGQISELKHKNEKLEEDVCESARKIKFYKQRLAGALLEKEANDLEIASLMTSLDVIGTVMDSASFDFAD